tara:strand:- start:2621 stop:3370 length:750 start_codon:yes stop_codon:yes gene_type:complete
MTITQKPTIVFLGTSGHIAPVVIKELLKNYNILGISRNASLRKTDGYEGIEFDFEKSNYESIKNLINLIYSKYGSSIKGFIFNFYYGYPEEPDNLNDENILKACMGIFGKQMQLIDSIYEVFKSSLSLILISSMYSNLNPKYKNYENNKDFNALLYGSMKAAFEKGGKWFISYKRGSKIRLNILRLGPFPNYSVQKLKPKFIKNLSKNTELNSIGYPEDIVSALEFLLSERSKYCQGSTVTIDGGWSIS